MDYSFPWIEF
jgi:hypothetical protein